MLRITIVCVGRLKEKYFTDASAEYGKRLGRYCRLEIAEVADEKTPDGASRAEEEQIRNREGGRILKNIREDDYVIALAIEGKQLSSP
ncbi:MAG: 23S rRNA (pseudouridine(1915)-N(3))-methyltransferase RlmH, partial [Lachnospiraceae bacterium]|nr:23S rRNA (pseudouridine(1915)-N(3))-methyltransferase RlmH [Lachnospiraceae bacterium]